MVGGGGRARTAWCELTSNLALQSTTRLGKGNMGVVCKEAAQAPGQSEITDQYAPH